MTDWRAEVRRLIGDWDDRLGEAVANEYADRVLSFAARYAEEKVREAVACLSGPHRHFFTWSSGNSVMGGEPPADAVAVRGGDMSLCDTHGPYATRTDLVGCPMCEIARLRAERDRWHDENQALTREDSPTASSPFLTLRDAAAFLRISPRTLGSREWREENAVPVLRIGDRVLFDPEELRTWLRERRDGS